MRFKKRLQRVFWLLTAQLGLNPILTVKAIKGLPRYFKDARKFRVNYTGNMEYVPCLHDWYSEAGESKSEYFLQDLLVAKMIFKANPEKHVDVGSRVDGFVAHVASFREIEVFDVRPMPNQIPGIKFIRKDLMNPLDSKQNYCDSLSCLHALEHFGLGRYGDPVNPKGFEAGLANLAGLICKGGRFYLSVPIGVDRVEFNANRVFDPRKVVHKAAGHSLVLTELTVIKQNGRVEISDKTDTVLDALATQPYALGIFIFQKM